MLELLLSVTYINNLYDNAGDIMSTFADNSKVGDMMDSEEGYL